MSGRQEWAHENGHFLMACPSRITDLILDEQDGLIVVTETGISNVEGPPRAGSEGCDDRATE